MYVRELIGLVETEATMKGRVGAYEYWLAGKLRWEVRKDGEVLAVKQNMSDAFQAAKRLYDAEKRSRLTEDAAPAAFHVEAFPSDSGSVSLVDAIATFATWDAAEAFAAQFPKSLRLRVIGYNDPANNLEACVMFRPRFSPTEVTGEKNEASLKRVRKFMAVAPIVWKSAPQNRSFRTREAFEIALHAM